MELANRAHHDGVYFHNLHFDIWKLRGDERGHGPGPETDANDASRFAWLGAEVVTGRASR